MGDPLPTRRCRITVRSSLSPRLLIWLPFGVLTLLVAGCGEGGDETGLTGAAAEYWQKWQEAEACPEDELVEDAFGAGWQLVDLNGVRALAVWNAPGISVAHLGDDGQLRTPMFEAPGALRMSTALGKVRHIGVTDERISVIAERGYYSSDVKGADAKTRMFDQPVTSAGGLRDVSVTAVMVVEGVTWVVWRAVDGSDPELWRFGLGTVDADGRLATVGEPFGTGSRFNLHLGFGWDDARASFLTTDANGGTDPVTFVRIGRDGVVHERVASPKYDLIRGAWIALGPDHWGARLSSRWLEFDSTGRAIGPGAGEYAGDEWVLTALKDTEGRIWTGRGIPSVELLDVAEVVDGSEKNINRYATDVRRCVPKP